jgi:tetratricopeptide (TPR) repeat protein
MAEIGQKMASASPEEVAAMGARANAQMSYELSGAQMLKNQGNVFHSEGKYNDALQKYTLAKNNLKVIPTSKGRTLMLACSLNMMSCFLKTKQYDECIKEGTDVLAYDANNPKALYRRGQAFREMGNLQDAITDLTKALEVCPDDETIAGVLRETNERFKKEGGQPSSRRGVVIEDITEEEEGKIDSTPVSQPNETSGTSQSQRQTTNRVPPANNAEYLQTLKNDPESIRSFQNFISQADPETLANLSGGNMEGISPDMMKTASNMIGNMSPEELQKMVEMATSFQGGAANKNSPLNPSSSTFRNINPSSLPPDVTPDMLKSASDMMSKMPPGELQKMFEMASSLRGNDPLNNNISSTSRENVGNETSSSSQPFLNSNFPSSSSSQSSFPSSSSGMQEQLRTQMADPAMREMFSSMVKNMSPETMASMSEQFGFKLSKEDAEKAQQAMSSLSPDALDKMMKWADRIQRGVEGAKKTKNFFLGRSGLILAVFMLILAFFLHRLGFIGS